MTITLKAARVNAGLSQKEAVTKLEQEYRYKLTRQRLASYEKEPDKVTIELASKLAAVYKLNVNDIFFGS